MNTHFFETNQSSPRCTEIDRDELKLKNIMRVFENLTISQKEALGVDKSITALHLRTSLYTMMTCSGFFVGFTTCFIKAFTTHLGSDGLCSGFLIFAPLTIASAICQLKFLNFGMEMYDQLDTVPVFQSSEIVANIAAGAIILQETQLYTNKEFWLVVIFGLITISGSWIKLLVQICYNLVPSKEQSKGNVQPFLSLFEECKDFFNARQQIRDFEDKTENDKEEIKDIVNLINTLISDFKGPIKEPRKLTAQSHTTGSYTTPPATVIDQTI
jgi:hypothetical protein